MSCEQCNGTTKTGNRCKLKTCKFSPFCHHHTKVEVRQSNIPNAGRGLFAKEDIRQNEVFGNYKLGTQRMSQQQFNDKYPNNDATHVAKIGQFYYDAINPRKSIAGMANTRRGRNNAKINNNGKLVAIKRIPEDREIYLRHGRTYRQNF